MTLGTHEFIRRFLMHVLPKGFHRIRHNGLFANTARAENIAKARVLLAVKPVKAEEAARAGKVDDGPYALAQLCPCCGGRMIVIEGFARGFKPKYRPPAVPPVRIDTSRCRQSLLQIVMPTVIGAGSSPAAPPLALRWPIRC
jgi:Putative transposase